MTESEIVTAVPKAEAVSMAEIHAMRQLSDSVAAQTKFFGEAMTANTRALERVVERVDGMNERLIRLEEQKHDRQIERLTEITERIAARTNELEAWRDKAVGAGNLFTWMRTATPWLLAIIMTALAAAGFRPDGN